MGLYEGHNGRKVDLIKQVYDWIGLLFCVETKSVNASRVNKTGNLFRILIL